MSSVQKLVTDEDVFPTKYGMSLAACTPILIKASRFFSTWLESLGFDCKWGLEGLQHCNSGSCSAKDPGE